MSSTLPIPPPPAAAGSEDREIIRYDLGSGRAIALPVSLLSVALRGERPERDAWETGLVSARERPEDSPSEP
ncbi:hypothetical protein IHV25_01540 [Phaeovibrio sulfidiphilus]|uniref:Uncharacterized protein n=1 Tax=Phaeovibrio sulfidiphilus TaxID=1220600 RepID=A0A8J6YX59_9PROT|nr:hypothetical protein [Phaeovibrio sulfidiphilus]MBE1236338.1 hypothetical protein [Phaeovibrio sulfidiphilus]